jgi:hypothetical protein
MASSNGESVMPGSPLEIADVLNIETNEGETMRFEVVGILEDPEANGAYAVLMHEPAGGGDGEFIVTDLAGTLLEDDALAQEILDEFLAYADENESAAPEEEKS